jgi:hypothetical protein
MYAYAHSTLSLSLRRACLHHSLTCRTKSAVFLLEHRRRFQELLLLVVGLRGAVCVEGERGERREGEVRELDGKKGRKRGGERGGRVEMNISCSHIHKCTHTYIHTHTHTHTHTCSLDIYIYLLHPSFMVFTLSPAVLVRLPPASGCRGVAEGCR